MFATNISAYRDSRPLNGRNPAVRGVLGIQVPANGRFSSIRAPTSSGGSALGVGMRACAVPHGPATARRAFATPSASRTAAAAPPVRADATAETGWAARSARLPCLTDTLPSTENRTRPRTPVRPSPTESTMRMITRSSDVSRAGARPRRTSQPPAIQNPTYGPAGPCTRAPAVRQPSSRLPRPPGGVDRVSRRPKMTDAFGGRRIHDRCVAHRSQPGVCSLFSPCARGAPTPSVLPVIFGHS